LLDGGSSGGARGGGGVVGRDHLLGGVRGGAGAGRAAGEEAAEQEQGGKGSGDGAHGGVSLGSVGAVGVVETAERAVPPVGGEGGAEQGEARGELRDGHRSVAACPQEPVHRGGRGGGLRLDDGDAGGVPVAAVRGPLEIGVDGDAGTLVGE